MKAKIYPWIIVLCCCGLLMGSVSLTTNTAGLLFKPIAADLGVGVGNVAFYLTVLNFTCGILGTQSIRLVKKIDVRILLALSAVLTAVSYLGMSRSGAVWQLYIFGFMQGAATSMFGFVMTAAIINNWFRKNIGLAVGAAFAFSGIASALLNPIINGWIEGYGWRTTCLYLAGSLIIVVIPAILLVRMTPAQLNLPRYGEGEMGVAAEGLADKVRPVEKDAPKGATGKLILICMIAFMGAFTTGFASHMSSYGTSIGLTAAAGALMMSATMAGNSLSKVLIGILCDLLDPKRACWIFLSCMALSFVLLFLCPVNNIVLLMVAAFLVGFTFSIGGVGVSSMSRQIFGGERFASSYSRVTLVAYTGSALSYSVLGVAYDTFGSYRPSIVVCALLACMAIFVVWLVYRDYDK